MEFITLGIFDKVSFSKDIPPLNRPKDGDGVAQPLDDESIFKPLYRRGRQYERRESLRTMCCEPLTSLTLCPVEADNSFIGFDPNSDIF